MNRMGIFGVIKRLKYSHSFSFVSDPLPYPTPAWAVESCPAAVGGRKSPGVDGGLGWLDGIFGGWRAPNGKAKQELGLFR